MRSPPGSAPLRRVRGERAPESPRARAGGGARASPYTRVSPYIGERFARPGYRACPKRAGGRGTSVVLGQIELVGGDHRNGGRGKRGQLELPVEVGAADFPMAEGIFEMQRAFPGLGARANSRRSATWAR
jgi:hypothetical protein